jgi:hypothetical protein
MLQNKNKDTVIVSGFIKRTTARAVLFDDGGVVVWLPRSQIDESLTHIDEDKLEEITIPDWLAKENDLI